jgi:hypothetical protein
LRIAVRTSACESDESLTRLISPQYRGGGAREAAAEAGEEVVAERAVGIQAGLAAAFGRARVEERPELDRAGAGAGQLDRTSSREICIREREPRIEAVGEADMGRAAGGLDEILNDW